jgi:hypothetical protein
MKQQCAESVARVLGYNDTVGPVAPADLVKIRTHYNPRLNMCFAVIDAWFVDAKGERRIAHVIVDAQSHTGRFLLDDDTGRGIESRLMEQNDLDARGRQKRARKGTRLRALR